MSAEKSMSSRLLTMKFMQRAAVTSSPTTPKSPGTPTNDPPSKRQRLSAGGSRSRYSDHQAIQAALAEEEAKRSQALERHALEMGETRWVLSVKRPDIPQASELVVENAGFGDIDGVSDEDEDSEEENEQVGRMTFGKAVKKDDNDSDSDSADSDDDSNEDDEEEDEEEYDPMSVTQSINQAKNAAYAPKTTPKSPKSPGFRRGPPPNKNNRGFNGRR